MTRRRSMILFFVLFLYGCGSMRYYVCGIEIKREDLSPYTFAGVLASVGTHIAGHYLFAEINGVEIHQEGFKEVIDDYDRASDVRRVARGGFVLQHSVNVLLTTLRSTRGTRFVKGFTLASAIEVWFYPLRFEDPDDEGDFYILDEFNGNGAAEHRFFSAVALYNLLIISFDEEER